MTLPTPILDTLNVDLPAKITQYGADQFVAGAASRDVEVTTLNQQVVTLQGSVADLNAQIAAMVPVDRGPVSMAFEDLPKRLKYLPAGVNLVRWSAVAAAGDTLEDVFIKLGANDLLVLEERVTPLGIPDPYLVDLTEGFRAAGVSFVSGYNGAFLPIVNTYKKKTTRCFFAGARSRVGIVGLGPKAVVGINPGKWTQEQQMRPKGKINELDGKVSPGRNAYGAKADGTPGAATGWSANGCTEKIIETEATNGYYGNFVLAEAPDLGGVAFNGISLHSGAVERLASNGGWRGFSDTPNGEAGAVTFNKGTYVVSRCVFDGRNSTGKRVGSSPFMSNSNTGGLVEESTFMCSRAGMPTIWNPQPNSVHRFVNVDSLWNASHGVNLEQVQPGVTFSWSGGRCWPNRAGKGGHPSPDGVAGNGLHVGLDARGPVSIVFTDVGLDTNVTAGYLCVQGYGSTAANLANVKVSRTEGGAQKPVKVF